MNKSQGVDMTMDVHTITLTGNSTHLLCVQTRNQKTLSTDIHVRRVQYPTKKEKNTMQTAHMTSAVYIYYTTQTFAVLESPYKGAVTGTVECVPDITNCRGNPESAGQMKEGGGLFV